MSSKPLDEKFSYKSGDNLWFTSDTHFGHENILNFCKRPFADINEMNEVLIENWNRVVKPDDTVFHLGDFAIGGAAVWTNALSKLNGHIHLILGNHDMKNMRAGYEKYFEWIGYQKQIVVEDRHIYLNHYPFLCYGGTYRQTNVVWQLYGHVHSSDIIVNQDKARLVHCFPMQYDVGVDNNTYTPVSFASIKEIINRQINNQNKTL